jgi:hypothetical protein
MPPGLRHLEDLLVSAPPARRVQLPGLSLYPTTTLNYLTSLNALPCAVFNRTDHANARDEL